jgi:hypothetical protein
MVRCFGQERTIGQCERIVAGRPSLEVIEEAIQTSLAVSIRSGVRTPSLYHSADGGPLMPRGLQDPLDSFFHASEPYT